MKIIDVHTHGIGGYDTRTTDVEHILKIAEIHGSYGVTEIIPTVYPATVKVMRDNLSVIKKAMEAQDSRPVLKPEFCSLKYGPAEERKPARIIGVHLEGPFLNPLKCGSLNTMAFIDPTDYNLEQLIEGFEDMIRIITISPELDGALALIKRISARGIIASMGHSNATYSEAEAGHKAGAKGITHLFNAMRPYHHREPGITGYGLLDPDIYIEVIADPFHLHPGTFELIFRVKDPARIIIVSDSIREAKVPATPVSTPEGLADIHGRLLGGSMAITEAADHLAEILPNTLLDSHNKSIMLNCISANPERYLS
jgi:N-acetylglucosamine-6-phosphate deacetylase